MDAVSNAILSAQENILVHSRSVRENVMNTLKEVLVKAEITHTKPLGNIRNIGMKVDTYA